MIPTIDQIRDAIADVISAVPDSGKVHSYERYAKREAAFHALYRDSDVIRGWNIRRRATEETQPAVGRYRVLHRWQLRAYRSLDDEKASERAFDSMIEAVRDAFRADETLGGVVADTVLPDGTSGLQIDDSGPVLFAGVLCHSARGSLATVHYL